MLPRASIKALITATDVLIPDAEFGLPEVLDPEPVVFVALVLGVLAPFGAAGSGAFGSTSHAPAVLAGQAGALLVAV